MKKLFLKILLFFLFGSTVSVVAQTEPDDIAAVTDDFQENFFESLKQKGIENYDKAILALEKCKKIQPNNATVFYELGKNYMFAKEYQNAYDSYEKAAGFDPKNKWYLNGMYEVSFRTEDFFQSIIIVEKLVEFDKGYKEDLATLYMKTKQFDKALNLINDLNENIGKSEKRQLYKSQILLLPEFQGAERANLLNQIKNNPNDEGNYIALINLYTTNNQEKEALEITKKLEIAIPTSSWAQISLFKQYINKNDGTKAVIAMDNVLSSNRINAKVKHKVLNDFLIFVKNNSNYNVDLQRAITYFKDDKEVNVAKEVGKFYQNIKDWEKAIQYYEIDANKNPNDAETALLLLESYIAKLEFNKAEIKADAMMALFPLQPQFYYYGGLANNQLKNFKKSINILEIGMDYLVDDIPLEVNFNIQLGEAYSGLGDLKKKEMYFLKADKLLKQNK